MSDTSHPNIWSVASLWRYPVKSLRGEELPNAQITKHGMSGDRTYAILNQETGIKRPPPFALPFPMGRQ